ncbi:MAG: hypothetical protein ACKVIF_06995 [Rhodospirillales bacterium]
MMMKYGNPRSGQRRDVPVKPVAYRSASSDLQLENEIVRPQKKKQRSWVSKLFRSLTALFSGGASKERGGRTRRHIRPTGKLSRKTPPTDGRSSTHFRRPETVRS